MSHPPRTLFHNARVWTPAGRFERRALLVSKNRIDALVGRGDEAALARGGDVAAIDLLGGFVVPGFVDTHFHLLALALKSLRCDLGGARSPGDVVETLSRYASAHAESEVVVGVDWDESDWSDSRPPTRAELDRVSETRPVYARRICGHMAAVNSAFLRALEAPRRFVDEETGLLTEDAVYAANAQSGPPEGVVAGAIEGAIGTLHALGVTGIHDVVTKGRLDAYLAGVLGAPKVLRVDALLVGTTDDLVAMRERVAGVDTDRFRAVGIKLFADGSIGAKTAALHEPYAGESTRGELLLERDELRAALRGCADLGCSCAVHAIGDRAVGFVLDAIDAVGNSDGRFRIEHAEVLGEGEIEAAVRLGVWLSMQPNFARNWGGEGGLYERRLGRDRWLRVNPFRTLESRGASFVFGSDGMPPGPLYGLRGATHHPVPGESIPVASALRRYTEVPHTLPGHERPAGRLEAGSLADFAVLSGDPLIADADALSVTATCVGGEIVHRAAGRPPKSLR
jgi:predicted amidohydrolase YtcJ